MTTKKKAVLKKTIAGWLCFAALTSGMVVPAYLPSVFPTMTAAAEEPPNELKGEINLDNLVGYLAGSEPLPQGVTIQAVAQFGDAVEIQISQSGTYKLTGSNKVGDAYYDLSIIITGTANVTLDCYNVFIKNDFGPQTSNAIPLGDIEYAGDCGFYIYNYVTPFKVEKDAALTIKGKLYADTAFAVNNDGTQRAVAPLYKDLDVDHASSIIATSCNVGFYKYIEDTNPSNSDNFDQNYKDNYFDKNYCLQLSNGPYGLYNIREYIDTNKYPCFYLTNSSEGDRFTGGTNVILSEL